MQFQFESFDAFLRMNGHGPYVWLTVAVTLTVMAWLVLRPLLQQKATLNAVCRDIARNRRREQAGAQGSQESV